MSKKNYDLPFFKTIFKYIINDLLLLKGSNYTHVIDEENISLITSEFICSFDSYNTMFAITFKIAQTGKNIAEIMTIILSYIKPSELYIIDDFYFDKNSKDIIYGEAAIFQRQMDILRKAGKDKCNMCDKIVSMKKLSENKICDNCIKNYDKFNWC